MARGFFRAASILGIRAAAFLGIGAAAVYAASRLAKEIKESDARLFGSDAPEEKKDPEADDRVFLADFDGDGVPDAVCVDLDGDDKPDVAYVDTDGDSKVDAVYMNEKDPQQEEENRQQEEA